jgi:predicted metal-dependent phosphoesterase TrpH
MNILQNYPNPQELLNWYASLKKDNLYKVNGHIHTPFSFSAFTDIAQIFEMAKKENIKVLGINDFYVTDGYSFFYEQALKDSIFPLFNIEFIGLLKEEQANHIHINDPNNPGRCYFSGKGLNYPFKLSNDLLTKLNAVIKESQVQVQGMIDKTNQWFAEINIGIKLDFNAIKKKFAKELIRERHIAKAIRFAVYEKASSEADRKTLLQKIYGGKDTKVNINDVNALENEIRGNLLKAGGKAFVEEDEKAFMSIDEIIKIIQAAGGIPCYPVLLDDKNGHYTEYEANKENLYEELTKRNIGCIELIPGRNDFNHLKNFVKFFYEKGFIINFGTEHNTPDMIPLTCDTRGNKPLDEELNKISYEGACIIAAHQYLRTKGIPSFINESGKPENARKDYFIQLGKAVIEKFLTK